MSVSVMAAVWRADLPRDEKIVALAFADHADDYGRCFPSLGRIAWKTGYSKRSVRRKASSLHEKGVLRRLTDGGGRSNPAVYVVDPSAVPELKPYKPGVENSGQNPAKLSGKNEKPGQADTNPDTYDEKPGQDSGRGTISNRQREPSSAGAHPREGPENGAEPGQAPKHERDWGWLSMAVSAERKSAIDRFLENLTDEGQEALGELGGRDVLATGHDELNNLKDNFYEAHPAA